MTDKGPLLTLALMAWLTARGASALAFALALIPALAWAVVSWSRHVFGSGVAVASPSAGPGVLAAGAAAPLLRKLGAPAELVDSLALLAVFVATALIMGATLTKRAGSVGPGVCVLLLGAAVPILTDIPAASTVLYMIILACGALAYLALQPPAPVSAAVRWWRALAPGSRTAKGT